MSIVRRTACPGWASRLRLERALWPAHRVDPDLGLSRVAAQRFVELGLDTRLADLVARAVQLRVTVEVGL